MELDRIGEYFKVRVKLVGDHWEYFPKADVGFKVSDTDIDSEKDTLSGTVDNFDTVKDSITPSNNPVDRIRKWRCVGREIIGQP